MPVAQFTFAEWLALLQHELLLLAAVFFAIGLLDELAVDASYAWLRITGRANTPRIQDDGRASQPLSGMAAVFIPAWEEDAVIGPTHGSCVQVLGRGRIAHLCGLLSQ